MKRLLLAGAFALLAALLAAAPTAAFAAPPNDDVLSAVQVTSASFSTQLDTTTATTAPSDPYCSGNSATVWYAVTPPFSGTLDANTYGSNYDTTLSVYTGSPGALTQIACDDDTSSGLQSEVQVSVAAG